MKIIAITQRLIRNDAYPEIREALDIRWADLAETAGFLLLPLPIMVDFGNYAKKINIDGIILSGGNDLALFSTDELSRMRDEFEKRLLDYAVQTRTPVLGVCRGMQVICDYFGAELVVVAGHAGLRHKISTTSNSTYWQNQIPGEVNSYHGYGVSSLPEVLRESARSEDGLIEAIEHTTLPIVGQMWHPERETTFQEYDLAMIRKLFRVKD